MGRDDLDGIDGIDGIDGGRAVTDRRAAPRPAAADAAGACSGAGRGQRSCRAGPHQPTATGRHPAPTGPLRRWPASLANHRVDP
jgi:hypothetical protein